MPSDVRMLQAQPALPVSDLERAFAFYERLGFQKHDPRRDVHLRIQNDGVILHLATQIARGVGGCQDLVEGVDELHRTCQVAGARGLHALQDEPGGTRDFTVLVPDGNAVTFEEVLPT